MQVKLGSVPVTEPGLCDTRLLCMTEDRVGAEGRVSIWGDLRESGVPGEQEVRGSLRVHCFVLQSGGFADANTF